MFECSSIDYKDIVWQLCTCHFWYQTQNGCGWKERGGRACTDFHFFKVLDICMYTMSHQNKVICGGLHVGAEDTAVGE